MSIDYSLIHYLHETRSLFQVVKNFKANISIVIPGYSSNFPITACVSCIPLDNEQVFSNGATVYSNRLPRIDLK